MALVISFLSIIILQDLGTTVCDHATINNNRFNPFCVSQKGNNQNETGEQAVEWRVTRLNTFYNPDPIGLANKVEHFFYLFYLFLISFQCFFIILTRIQIIIIQSIVRKTSILYSIVFCSSYNWLL